MKIKTNLNLFYYILCISLYLTSISLNNSINYPRFLIPQNKKAINFNSDFLKIFSLGEKRLVSNIIWIKTLLTSDTTKYKNFDLNSWMFLRFNNISILDPYFILNYRLGFLYLGVIKDDLKGATYLLKKGLQYYPNNFELNLAGATHYLFELNQPKKALKLLEKIQNHPRTPFFVKSLIARIYAGDTNLSTAKVLIKEAMKTAPKFLIKRYEMSLYSINAEIDLNCLNSRNDDTCNRKDYYGKPYLYKDGKFQAQTKWKTFRVFIPKYYKKKGLNK